LIEIDGIYHNLFQVEGSSSIKVLVIIHFNFTQNEFTYKVGGVSKSINTIVDFNNPPKSLIFIMLSLPTLKTLMIEL
jgi:hypothetical protein